MAKPKELQKLLLNRGSEVKNPQKYSKSQKRLAERGL